MNSRDSSLWDVEAEAFDEEPDHGLRDLDVRAAWRRLLASVIPPGPSRIADLGCGTGSLSLLLVEEGHRVDGVDFSPEMVRRANAKAGSFPGTSFALGDAAAPDLPPAAYDVVLCRHVLWALPSPAEALARWVELLTPEGRLVLVEGNWSTGAGLTAEQTVSLVEEAGLAPTLRPLPESEYWGKQIEDERYLVVGRRRA
ncbi:MAG: class I SAM-dependent methyltransferase [Nocardioides sp.]